MKRGDGQCGWQSRFQGGAGVGCDAGVLRKRLRQQQQQQRDEVQRAGAHGAPASLESQGLGTWRAALGTEMADGAGCRCLC